MPRQELVEALVAQAELAELQNLLGQTPSRGRCAILEAMPLEDRLMIWELVKAGVMARFFWKFRSSSRKHSSLRWTVVKCWRRRASSMPTRSQILRPICRVTLGGCVPVPAEEEREQYAPPCPTRKCGGRVMDFDVVTIREDCDAGSRAAYLRRLDELPDHTDQVFVVDRMSISKGCCRLNRLLVNDPDATWDR